MDLVILDRDGVINQDSEEFIKTPEEWRAIPGSLEAIARLHQAGRRVVIATNQSGLRRRLFDIETLNRIHEKMYRELAELGGCIDAIFFCPCRPRDACDCRKPSPGMLIEIGARLSVPLAGVPVVGDSRADALAAQAVGARPILVRTGKHDFDQEVEEVLFEVEVYDDLAEAVDILLHEDDGP